MMNIRTTKKVLRYFGANGIAVIVGFCAAASLAACSAAPANLGIADSEITAGVRSALAADAGLVDYAIQVKTADGRVHLAGKVDTDADRNNAEAIAAASRGVVSVDNYLHFGP